MSKEEFKILTDREHIQSRPGMYVGSVSRESTERFLLGKWSTVTYVPALSKIIDEIIDNSLDEAIRTNFKHANKISVSVNGDKVTVEDNGRGIPQDKIFDSVTGKKLLRPVAAWTKTKAGTSFDDNRVTIGANGVGSACANFLSSEFTGTTWSNGNKVIVHCTEGGLHVDVTNRKCAGNGTKVEFEPDFNLLEVSSLDELDTIKLIEERMYGLQMSFPEITFMFNNKKIDASTIKKYASMFDDGSVVIANKHDVSLFFAASSDGFRSNSFINGVNTRLGGAYVDYVSNGVTEELMAMIKRKHKIEVNKTTIKSGLTFIIFARNFTNPKFDSQTKERLTSTQGNVKTHYQANGMPELKVLAQKIMACEDIIEPIIEAQLAKKLAADKRAATLAQKKLRKVKVAKHIAAVDKDATLFICEGDSAIAPLVEVRDPKTTGGFPLRGVVKNTWDLTPADVMKNKELSELIAIIGLDITNPNALDNLFYKDIAILVDADHDGLGHIAPLLMAFFFKFWPKLFEDGRIHLTRSPIMISTKGRTSKWFYDMNEAKEFKTNNEGYKHRYIKGLGSLTSKEYSDIINKPKFATIKIDDKRWLEVMFGNDSAPRKEWLNGNTPSIFQ